MVDELSAVYPTNTIIFAMDDAALPLAVSSNAESILGVHGEGDQRVHSLSEAIAGIYFSLPDTPNGQREYNGIDVMAHGIRAKANLKITAFRHSPAKWLGVVAVRNTPEHAISDIERFIDIRSDITFTFDPTGICRSVQVPRDYSPRYPLNYYPGKHAGELWPGEFSETILKAIPKVLATQQPELLAMKLLVHGAWRYYEGRMVSVGSDSVVALLRNITATVLIRQHYEAVFEASRTLFGFFAWDGSPMKLSTAWGDITQQPYELLMQRRFIEYIGFQDRKLAEAALTKAQTTGERQKFSGKLDFPSTSIVYNWMLIPNREAQIFYVIGQIPGFTQFDSRSPFKLTEEKYGPQQAFLSMVMHEIRSPLTVISMLSSLLDTEGIGADEKRKHLESIDSCVARIRYMSDELLMLGRLESGRCAPCPSDFDLAKFIKDVIEEVLRASPHKREVRFKHDGVASIRSDKVLLNHAISNLLTNALKYSPKDKPVDIRLSLTPHGELRIDVQDYGIGIPEEDFENIFLPYHRASNAAAHKGTGIGLYITKSCVEKALGLITFTSSLERGTTFTITLPVK